jgi:hypothetical protein
MQLDPVTGSDTGPKIPTGDIDKSLRIEAGYVADCKSIRPTRQVEDLSLPGSPRDENDDII